MKTCPDCAEEVQEAARVCRYCGHRFDAAVKGTDVPREGRNRSRLFLGAGVLALILAAAVAVGILALDGTGDGGTGAATPTESDEGQAAGSYGSGGAGSSVRECTSLPTFEQIQECAREELERIRSRR